MEAFRDPVAASRIRRALIGVLLVLCFLGGLAAASQAARRWGWFGGWFGTPVTVTAAAPVDPQTAASQPAAPRAAASPGLPALAAREAALEGQVAALEARAAAVTADAGAAGGQAARGEALLTMAAVRRAAERGEPLGYLEQQLRLRFGAVEPRAVELTIRAARRPVTAEALRAELEALAPRLLGSDPAEGLVERLRGELGRLVVVRRAGEAPARPQRRLDAARRLLAGGQVAAAQAEVAALPGAALAAGWQDAARRLVLLDRALDALDRAALTAPVASEPAAAPASAPSAAPASGTAPPAAPTPAQPAAVPGIDPMLPQG